MDFDEREYAMEVHWDKPTDIVITDPCYLFQEESDQKWHDVLRMVDNNTPRRFSPNDAVRNKVVEEIWAVYNRCPGFSDKELKEMGTRAHMSMLDIEHDRGGTLDILKWAPAHPRALSPFGISKCLCGNTMYGDWGCYVVDDNRRRMIGEFTADAGMYIVCALEETPGEFRDWIKDNQNCAAVIPQFHGSVACEPIGRCFLWDKEEWCVDYTIRLVGSGSVDFHTVQVS